MEKPKVEDKFIVINKKRLQELNDASPWGSLGLGPNEYVTAFLGALENLNSAYMDTGKEMNQKYWVVNQDEPYADEVIKLILDGEAKKITPKKEPKNDIRI